MQQIIDKLQGKKRYILILTFATFDLLKAFEVVETTKNQDLSIYVFLLALLGLEVKSKLKLINKLTKSKK